MKKNNCYKYPKTQREKIEGKRHYVFDKEKLPSVTTILDSTQPAEKRESLERWKARVGEAAAEKIKTRAAGGGTAMNKILEKYIKENNFLQNIREEDIDVEAEVDDSLGQMVAAEVNAGLNSLPNDNPSKNRQTGLQMMAQIKQMLSDPAVVGQLVEDEVIKMIGAMR